MQPSPWLRAERAADITSGLCLAAVVRGEVAGGGVYGPVLQEAPRTGRVPGRPQERFVVSHMSTDLL